MTIARKRQTRPRDPQSLAWRGLTLPGDGDRVTAGSPVRTALGNPEDEPTWSVREDKERETHENEGATRDPQPPGDPAKAGKG